MQKKTITLKTEDFLKIWASCKKIRQGNGKQVTFRGAEYRLTAYNPNGSFFTVYLSDPKSCQLGYMNPQYTFIITYALFSASCREIHNLTAKKLVSLFESQDENSA